MIASPITTTGNSAVFARAVLNAAAEVEAAETQIKDAVIAAAQAGDCDRVIDIVTRWQNMAACEVLAGKPLATCGDLEVSQSEDRRDGRGGTGPHPPPAR